MEIDVSEDYFEEKERDELKVIIKWLKSQLIKKTAGDKKTVMDGKIFLNGTETTRATEFRLVGCNGADFVPPRPSGSFSAEVKKSELSATERAMWDLFNFQQKTGKPRSVRAKNPVEILFGGNDL